MELLHLIYVYLQSRIYAMSIPMLTSFGGLGIRKATDIAAPAFISCNATDHLTELILLQTLPALSFDD